MILTIETALHGIAHMLRERIVPATDDPFAGETARLADLLLTLNANWVDDAVAIRVAENVAIRSLFSDASSAITDMDLAERIRKAARSSDPGLKISELDGECNRLRELLVELHTHVEEKDDEIARALTQSIWRLLVDLEEARAPRG